MRRVMLWMAMSLMFLATAPVFAAEEASPIGLWKTIDDETGNPKAIIQITQNEDATFSGQILRIYPRPGFDQNELCEACKGDKRNKPIVGMVILNHLQASRENQNEWTDGKILDPMNGRVYQCMVKMADNNQKLKIRGYIGFPLFGRSQTWVREGSA